MRDLVRRRLVNQYLAKPTLREPSDVVARFGAVQAQDYAAAKWAIGQRLVGATDATVERAMNEGSILRTHVLRPTWHFVAPADIRWMLELTSARVKAAAASQWRTYELDEKAFRLSNTALAKALRGGNQLTRAELASALGRAKIDVTSGVRVGHLLMRAELDALICSGGRRGKQLTYALLDERVASAKPLTRDEALVELATRYFTTHGPATAKDFAWWSGLTIADAKAALAMIGDDLQHELVDGRSHWFPASAIPRSAKPIAHLLANYDEYVVGLSDRSAMVERLGSMSASATKALVFDHVILVGGQVVGTWPRTLGRDEAGLRFLTKITTAERQAILAAVDRYRLFSAP